MKTWIIVLLALIGVIQDLIVDTQSQPSWDRVFLRGFLTQARYQGWAAQPIALTRDKGIKGIAIDLNGCNSPAYLVPIVSGGEFDGVIRQFAMGFGYKSAYFYRSQWSKELPSLTFWTFRSIGTSSILPMQQRMINNTAVAAFWSPDCDVAPQQMMRYIDQTFQLSTVEG